jgi:hypothetical protein
MVGIPVRLISIGMIIGKYRTIIDHRSIIIRKYGVVITGITKEKRRGYNIKMGRGVDISIWTYIVAVAAVSETERKEGISGLYGCGCQKQCNARNQDGHAFGTHFHIPGLKNYSR